MKLSILTLITCLIALPVQAKYSGGSGTAQDPYRIATAADLIALGETPADYDKHFILTADIDLDPELPGRKVFDKAVIAPNWGTPFVGVFDGKGHSISHLTVKGKEGNLGLFGQLRSGAQVKDLGVVDINATGSGSYIGGLVGYSSGGTVTQCYSTGAVSGGSLVGGLVGENGGAVTNCYSTGAVSGDGAVGGLVGLNSGGTVTQCYSTGTVRGDRYVGGLVGEDYGTVLHSVWDTKTSGLSGSRGGVGLTTTEMMDPYMLGLNGFASDPNWVLDAGRDYPRLAWEDTKGQTIPWPKIDWLTGRGMPEEPYRIDTADQLILLGKASILWDKHFVLGADINLDPSMPGRQVFGQAVIPAFMGVFDGNGHTISHLTIMGESYLGLFGKLGGQVKDLGVIDVNITGSGGYVGGLVGRNDGTVANCYSTGAVSGRDVGGLVGVNWGGTMTQCYSTGTVNGGSAGGLVGGNGGNVIQCYSTGVVTGTSEYGSAGGLVAVNSLYGAPPGYVTQCYSTGAVSGWSAGGLIGQNGLHYGGLHEGYEGPFGVAGHVGECYSTGAVNGNYGVGGLVGRNEYGDVTHCYSSGAVGGNQYVGGLVGENSFWFPSAHVTECYSTSVVSGNLSVGGLVGRNDGTVANCYSTGLVTGKENVGGLVGYGTVTGVTASFWDIQTSGQTQSAGGTGKTTGEMQTAKTYLNAGWDFVGETANGTEDLWWILEGKDYPRLWWEARN
jgi:hypothetical protein